MFFITITLHTFCMMASMTEQHEPQQHELPQHEPLQREPQTELENFRASRTKLWASQISAIKEFSPLPPDSPTSSYSRLSELSAEIVARHKRRRALQKLAQPTAPQQRVKPMKRVVLAAGTQQRERKLRTAKAIAQLVIGDYAAIHRRQPRLN